MSNAREAPPLRVELAASRQLTFLLSAGHLGAFLVSVILATSTSGLALLCIVVVLSAYRSIIRHGLLRSSRSVVALVLGGEQSCALKMRNGRWIHGKVSASSYVMPWLIVLHAAIEQRTFGVRVILCADSMPQASHRRLRARLRWVRYGELGIDSTDAPL